MILRNKDRETLLRIFSSVNTPVEVWVYGSRVSGTAHEGSDLDLVIKTGSLQKLPIEILLAIKEKIKESNIPIVVEIFDWYRLPESFHRNIEAQHEVLYTNMDMMMNEPPAEYRLNRNLSDLQDEQETTKKKNPGNQLK